MVSLQAMLFVHPLEEMSCCASGLLLDEVQDTWAAQGRHHQPAIRFLGGGRRDSRASLEALDLVRVSALQLQLSRDSYQLHTNFCLM